MQLRPRSAIHAILINSFVANVRGLFRTSFVVFRKNLNLPAVNSSCLVDFVRRHLDAILWLTGQSLRCAAERSPYNYYDSARVTAVLARLCVQQAKAKKMEAISPAKAEVSFIVSSLANSLSGDDMQF